VRPSLGEEGIDLVIGTAGPDLEGVFQQRLWDDGFSCLLRADHPRLEEPWTLDLYCALKHVLIAPRGTPGSVVDTALEEQGRRRVVVTRVAQFVPAAHIVAGSDAIVTLPTRLAELLAPSLGLVVREPPLALPRFTIWQQWHGRQQSDPAHRWLRALVAQVAAHRP
jgi:DNA-binding transcriptional LysR family regulator